MPCRAEQLGLKTQPAPQPEDTCSVRPSYNGPDCQRVPCNDSCLIAAAGLLLPATLAARLGLRQLPSHVELGAGPTSPTRG